MYNEVSLKNYDDMLIELHNQIAKAEKEMEEDKKRLELRQFINSGTRPVAPPLGVPKQTICEKIVKYLESRKDVLENIFTVNNFIEDSSLFDNFFEALLKINNEEFVVAADLKKPKNVYDKLELDSALIDNTFNVLETLPSFIASVDKREQEGAERQKALRKRVAVIYREAEMKEQQARSVLTEEDSLLRTLHAIREAFQGRTETPGQKEVDAEYEKFQASDQYFFKAVFIHQLRNKFNDKSLELDALKKREMDIFATNHECAEVRLAWRLTNLMVEAVDL